jgi:dipeptidyl aminopeptidase/acylaminoacyl peptidase
MRLKHAPFLGALLLPPLLQGQQARPWQSTDYYRLTVVSNPQLAPDGRRVAFVVTTVVEDKDRRHNEIWLSPSDGSAAPLRYTSPSTEASSPIWSPDGSLLAFSSKRDGSDDDIWFLRTSAPGGEAFQITGVHALPVFSRDGKWLLYEWRGEEPDSTKKETWRTRVSPAAITRGADPKRFDGRVYVRPLGKTRSAPGAGRARVSRVTDAEQR